MFRAWNQGLFLFTCISTCKWASWRCKYNDQVSFEDTIEQPQKSLGRWATKCALGLQDNPHSAIGETPYFLAFGAKVVIPFEEGLSNHRTTHFSHKQNDKNLRAKLDLFKERWEVANFWMITYKQCSARYYSSYVKQRMFRIGDLVLRKVMLNTKDVSVVILSLT